MGIVNSLVEFLDLLAVAFMDEVALDEEVTDDLADMDDDLLG